MKKYRIKPYVNLLNHIQYSIEKRFMLILWISVESFHKKDEAIEYCNKLTENININKSSDISIKSGTCFFDHKWTKWKQQNVEMKYIQDGKVYNGFDTIQTRYCIRCNKIQKEDVIKY